MSNTTTTPNMNLVLPIPGIEVGPTYAAELNQAFTTVDEHSHVPGAGLPIPTAGLNINADLTFNNLYNIIGLRSTRYASQGSALALVTDIDCCYVVGPDLWYNDGSGNQIQITVGGSVNSSGAGNISGMGSTTATAVYTAINSLFTFNSNTLTPANFKIGPVSIGLNSASPKFVTLSPNGSQVADYDLVFPVGLPASQKFATIDASGNIASDWAVDSSTIVVAANTVKVPAGGITATELANTTVTAAKIANGTITTTQISNSAGITGTQIAGTTIAAANIVANTITSSQIANNTISATQIANNTITSTQIANSTITTTQIASATIAGSNIAAATVTRQNQVAVGEQIGSSSGIYSTNSASYVAISNLSLSLAVTGRPVILMLQGSATDVDGNICGDAGTYARAVFLRGATAIAHFSIGSSDGPITGFGMQYCMDQPTAGTYTYSVQTKVISGAGSVNFNNVRLVAFEL